LPEDLVRVDHGLAPGLEIGPHYDALLAKLIAHGADREQARRKLSAALRALRVLGVQTNQAFLGTMLEHEAFVAGRAATDFLDLDGGFWQRVQPPEPMALAAAAVLFAARSESDPPYALELAGFTNTAPLAMPMMLEADDQ